MTDGTLGASFRDPSEIVLEGEGVIYRQLNRSYAADFDRLLSSGLYDALVERRRAIAVGDLTLHHQPRVTPYTRRILLQAAH